MAVETERDPGDLLGVREAILHVESQHFLAVSRIEEDHGPIGEARDQSVAVGAEGEAPTSADSPRMASSSPRCRIEDAQLRRLVDRIHNQLDRPAVGRRG